MATELNHC